MPKRLWCHRLSLIVINDPEILDSITGGGFWVKDFGLLSRVMLELPDLFDSDVSVELVAKDGSNSNNHQMARFIRPGTDRNGCAQNPNQASRGILAKLDRGNYWHVLYLKFM
jgi:hypothetical protein